MKTKNPYVGPRSFELNEKMYGRDRERRQLTDRLISERIVLLHSPSGAGKTSLVRAGLIPQLKEEGFYVHQVIRVNLEKSAELVTITDTLKNNQRFDRYTFSTLLSLEEQYPDTEHVDLAQLARMSLDDYLKYRSREDKRDGPEFLIFDQFEEVLTIDPTDRTAKNAFFAKVGAALKNRNRWALFVMRTDYVAALEPYVRSVPTYFSNTFHLELLGEKAALEAIQQPARDAGGEFTDAAAAKLVNDLRQVQVQQLDGTTKAQPGLYIEPVQLQVVCYRLWETKAAKDNQINEADLAGVVNVNQSLAEYYALSVSRVAQATGESERSIRDWFNRKLITPESIRSQVRMGAEASDGLDNVAVRQLENAHIIRAEKRAGQTWYELAHDRLIQPVQNDNWRWFESNLSLFQRQAVLWQEQGRSEGLLLRGDELETAEQQAKMLVLTPEETDFMKACSTLRAREKRDRLQRRLILVGAVVSFVFFIAALFFGIDSASANAGLRFAKQTADAAAYNAQAASTKAIEQQGLAQAASTLAIAQQATAQAASTQAIIQRSAAYAASTQAVEQQAIAYAAATQVAIEKAAADIAKANADAQALIAQSSELVAQSILANNQNNRPVAALLAVEALKLNDNPRTRIQLLNFAQNSLILSQSRNSGVTSTIAFSHDDTTLISANRFDCPDDVIYTCSDSRLTFWTVDKTTGGRIIRIGRSETGTQSGILDAIAVSADGRSVASAYCIPARDGSFDCEREEIILWDVSNRSALDLKTTITRDSANRAISNNKNVLMAYSPDGKFLAVGLNENSIIVLNAQTLEEVARLADRYESFQLLFTPDSQILMFIKGGDIHSWKFSTGEKPEIIPAGGVSNPVQSFAFSPDGVYFASGNRDGNITLWDTKTLTRLEQTLNYDTGARVRSLAFSPDGKILAAGYTDRGVILWDVDDRKELIRPFYNHTSNNIFSLAFSKDGKTLASVGNEVILWKIDPQQWVETTCQIAGRNLTQSEWILFFRGQEYNQTCPQYPPGR